MTAFGIAMVRDEADIIATTVRNMIGNVDEIIVADNGSVDGTRDILSDLARDLPVTVIDDPEVGYFQAKKMTRLAHLAGERGAEWIVPWDADELWYCTYGWIGEHLAGIGPGMMTVTADLYDHVATGIDSADLDPVRRLTWRREAKLPLPKMACRYRHDLTIHQGNHGCDYGGVLPASVPLLVARHFPYRSVEQFCNPPEAPIWMADLSFRDLGDIETGDMVMGAGRVPGVNKTVSMPAEVVAIHRRSSPVVRVEFESGRWLRCSPDHLWRQHFYGSGEKVQGLRGVERLDGRGWQDVRAFGSDGTYLPAKVGRSLSHVMAPTKPVSRSDERLAGWLGGIFDGEGWSDGHAIHLAQSVTANPDVYEDICSALKHFGFEFRRVFDRLVLLGGRQTYVDFFNVTQPRRRTTSIPSDLGDRLRNRLSGTFGARYCTADRIVAVEPDGADDVIGLTTTTGNYVAWGYASKNCRKVRNGAQAYRATDLPDSAGAHWRQWGQMLDEQGEDAVRLIYETWYFRENPRTPLCIGGEMQPPLIHDPAPI